MNDQYNHKWVECVRVGKDIDVLKYANGFLHLRHICTPLANGQPVRRTIRLSWNIGKNSLSAIPLTSDKPISCDECRLHGGIRNSQWYDVVDFAKDTRKKINWPDETMYWHLFSKDPANRDKSLNLMIEEFWVSRGGRNLYFDYTPTFGYVPRVWLREKN